MSKANSEVAALRLTLGSAALACCALLAASAQAEISAAAAGAEVVDKTAAADKSQGTTPRTAEANGRLYRLRCWQKGRLIIDEPAVMLGRDAPVPTGALRVRDQQQRPLFVTSSADTTCLVRPASEPQPAAVPGR